MKISSLLSHEFPDFQKALEYGLAEAQYLGKEFIGLTLSSGKGIIIRINPYAEEVEKILLMSDTEDQSKKLFAIFRYEGGNTYFIYEITDLSELYNILRDEKVIYVEVIKDVLEDFLLEAMGR